MDSIGILTVIKFGNMEDDNLAVVSPLFRPCSKDINHIMVRKVFGPRNWKMTTLRNIEKSYRTSSSV